MKRLIRTIILATILGSLVALKKYSAAPNNDVLEQLWDVEVYVGIGNHYGSSSVMYDKGTENRQIWKPIPSINTE